MTISVRFNEADAELVRKYAKMQGVTISELIRRAVIERIEDEIDLIAYKRAMAEFKKNPVTYTLEEIEKDLGL